MKYDKQILELQDKLLEAYGAKQIYTIRKIQKKLKALRQAGEKK